MQQHLLHTSAAAENLGGLMNDEVRVNDAGHRSEMKHLLEGRSRPHLFSGKTGTPGWPVVQFTFTNEIQLSL
jgi:hypothetical protein